MNLHSLNILNYRNIREANLTFAEKMNCFVGLNGQGKTNLLDAVYYLSFTKSALNALDAQNIMHGEDFALIQGEYLLGDTVEQISCGLKRGVKKQFRRGKKDYKRLIDHIGLIPLVMVCPQDAELITEGSDERRRFLDSVISQLDRPYLEHLTRYNVLLKQRNSLLKQYEDAASVPDDLFEVLELQMAQHADYIYRLRTDFMNRFVPLFRELYAEIAGHDEAVSLTYVSQLQDRDLVEAFHRTRSRDLILGWTSQGIHKDDLPMTLGDYPLKQVASQGQQKTFLLALKLAQALYLSHSFMQAEGGVPSSKPILLLDDIFDKLDSTRVERIIALLQTDRFGQIFITDTDRQHLTDIIRPYAAHSRIFSVSNGELTPL